MKDVDNLQLLIHNSVENDVTVSARATLCEVPAQARHFGNKASDCRVRSYSLDLVIEKADIFVCSALAIRVRVPVPDRNPINPGLRGEPGWLAALAPSRSILS